MQLGVPTRHRNLTTRMMDEYEEVEDVIGDDDDATHDGDDHNDDDDDSDDVNEEEDEVTGARSSCVSVSFAVAEYCHNIFLC